METNVSFIIPMYNVASSIERCLRSLQNLNYVFWEAIVIDDGGSDESLQISYTIAREDSRIQVLRKTNGGVSSARNMGLDYVRGKWISFLDSDDSITPTFLDCFLESNMPIDTSLIVHGYNQINENKIELVVNSQKQFCYMEECYELDDLLFRTPWGKLFKAEIVKENNLHFCVDIRFGEDMFFILEFLPLSHTIYLTGMVAYNYIVTKGSLSKSSTYYNDIQQLLPNVLTAKKHNRRLLAPDISVKIEAFLLFWCNESIKYLYKEGVSYTEKKEFYNELLSSFKISGFYLKPLQFGKAKLGYWLVAHFLPFAVANILFEIIYKK